MKTYHICWMTKDENNMPLLHCVNIVSKSMDEALKEFKKTHDVKPKYILENETI